MRTMGSQHLAATSSNMRFSFSQAGFQFKWLIASFTSNGNQCDHKKLLVRAKSMLTCTPLKDTEMTTPTLARDVTSFIFSPSSNSGCGQYNSKLQKTSQTIPGV